MPDTVPVPLMHARALNLINSDPEASRILQAQVDRLDPDGKVVPKNQLGNLMLDRAIETAMKPLREQNVELQKKLEKKELADYHESQRQIMRREYHLTEKQINELAEWMEKDGDGNMYKSYEAAYRYRQALSQPTLPTGTVPPQRQSAFSRQTIGSEPWREAFKRGSDPKHALRQSRDGAREWAKEMWQKSDQEFLESRR